MRSSDRKARRGIVFCLSTSVLLLAGAFGVGIAVGQEDPPRPIAHPLGAVPSGQAQAAAAAPANAPGLADRLRAARSAALSPGQPVPQPSPESAAPLQSAPIAERIGRDVTYLVRPGVGTPLQIRGDVLQARVERAAPGEDLDVSTAREFLRVNRALLGLDSPDDELAVRQRPADDLGLSHAKFEQRWHGLAVFPAELIVHLDRQGNVYLMDGAYVPTPRLKIATPIVTAGEAAGRARAAAPRGVRLSSPELLVYAPTSHAPRLAWRFDITGSPEEAAAVFIDAANGALLASIPLVMTENVPGSGINLFGQNISLNVWHEGASFLMVDTSKPMFHNGCNVDDLKQNCGAIYVGDAANTPPNSSPDISQATISQVTSSSANSWAPADAVSAASNFSKVFDYYKQIHSRNSIDGNGGNILAITRLGVTYQNAFWSDNVNGMFFGDAEKYAGSLDVVGHEMTHGVTSHTAGLLYQDQPGALNEAISDIFGEMVENFATGTNDWLIGSQITPIRNMADPGQFGDPATMSQFVTTTSDHGGVHTNSGIINHAYYLLAQGEAGAIGKSDAQRIFYRALTMHLTKNSQFLDARLAAVQSADELFGAGSNQSQKTGQAFDGVEILGATPAPPPPSSPPVTGSDSVLFLARNGANLVLSRRETALSDPAQGIFLPTPLDRAASEEKIALSGDGSLGFFVTSDNDACFFKTDASGSLACLNLPGTISAVAMTRDTNVYAFVLLSGGLPENLIRVIDLGANTTTTYTLLAPATDGSSQANVLFADTLDFSSNRRFLLYDAVSAVTVAGGGGQIALWSISAIDLTGGQVYTLLPPIAGLDIDNPSFARTSDNFFTFEVDKQSDGTAQVWAANVQTGALSQVVVNVPSGDLRPAYTGNDSGIVYAYPDSGAASGRSFALEALAGDRLTPSGNPQLNYLFDGLAPSIYRRGTYNGPSANCVANSTTLCLSGGRFQVKATFTTNTGQQGVASAVSLTSDTGYFTFFDPSNVEAVIKVLNACGVNQKLWVFAGGLTNVATVITVTDTLTGVSKTYTNPQNTPFVPIQDTGAFGTCFAGTALADSLSPESLKGDSEILRRQITRGIMELAGSRVAPVMKEGVDPEAVTACVQDNHTLCLSNNRFQVRTAWHASDGSSGSGNAVGLTADTGYFWFFSASNVEMVIKVLDACGINAHKWVFAGGLTNVEVTTTVTDTQTGSFRQYHNTLGQPFQPLQDTSAFSTCP
jgi:Zn-dependent metalloprotease